jgi:uncharacterized membrane protein
MDRRTGRPESWEGSSGSVTPWSCRSHCAIRTEQVSDTTTKNVLTRVERNITAAITPQPLTHIIGHDFAKGVGALIGIVLHFTFTYGVELGEHLSVARATILLGVTFVIGGALLYGTGFRNITDKTILWLLPYRLVVLFATAAVITTVILAFFYEHFFADSSLA